MARASKKAAVTGSQGGNQVAGDASPARFPRIHPRTLSLAAISLIAVSAAAFLFTQHPAHTLPYLPYLLLAACPLMHFFHHGRHH